jgi:hypothetical protein
MAESMSSERDETAEKLAEMHEDITIIYNEEGGMELKLKAREKNTSALCSPGRGHQAQHEACKETWCECRCHRRCLMCGHLGSEPTKPCVMCNPSEKDRKASGFTDKEHCSACGSTAPHHLKYVAEHGKCIV